MVDRRKKIVTLGCFGLFIVLQIYLFFFKPIEVLDHPEYPNQHPLPLFGETEEVSQDFRTSGPLARIDIMLANYLAKPKSGALRLTLFDKNNRPLFLKNFPANTAEDNRFYSFPIQNKNIPKGRRRLQLEYLQPDPSQKLAVWINNKTLYPYGNLYVNGIRREGSMTFRVYYYSTIWQERTRWFNAVPQFPARPYLLITALVLFLLLLNYLFYYFLVRPFY
jgi:hypothetical protein